MIILLQINEMTFEKCEYLKKKKKKKIRVTQNLDKVSTENCRVFLVFFESKFLSLKYLHLQLLI